MLKKCSSVIEMRLDFSGLPSSELSCLHLPLSLKMVLGEKEQGLFSVTYRENAFNYSFILWQYTYVVRAYWKPGHLLSSRHGGARRMCVPWGWDTRESKPCLKFDSSHVYFKLTFNLVYYGLLLNSFWLNSLYFYSLGLQNHFAATHIYYA